MAGTNTINFMEKPPRRRARASKTDITGPKVLRGMQSELKNFLDRIRDSRGMEERQLILPGLEGIFYRD